MGSAVRGDRQDMEEWAWHFLLSSEGLIWISSPADMGGNWTGWVEVMDVNGSTLAHYDGFNGPLAEDEQGRIWVGSNPITVIEGDEVTQLPPISVPGNPIVSSDACAIRRRLVLR